MHDLTVPKWLYLFPPTCYLEPADELCSFSLRRLSLSPPSFNSSSLRWQLLWVLFSEEPFHQEQMYSIIYRFSYLCALWLVTLFPAYLLMFMCFRQRFSARGWLYRYMNMSMCRNQWMLFSCFRCCSTLLFPIRDVISCYLAAQLSIFWIVAGTPQSASDLLLILFLLVTLKWMETERRWDYRTFCVCAAMCLCLRWSVCMFLLECWSGEENEWDGVKKCLWAKR